MMSTLKKGDRIVTVGGLYGIIRSIREDRVTLEIASEVFGV
jgi:preprotein translocase subunit YajC